MTTMAKVKEWITQNVPMLARLYNSKYVGMVYDRFGSLPQKQQKQLVSGSMTGLIALIGGYLLFSYISLWSQNSRSRQATEMVNMLQQYKSNLREKAPITDQLQRNSALAAPGQMKTYLIDQGRTAGISSKTMQVDERDLTEEKEEDGKTARDIKAKQSTVVLERVNLSQLKSFLSNVELGKYNMSISSLKIVNDAKIRGYLKVDISVVAYIFQPEQESDANG